MKYLRKILQILDFSFQILYVSNKYFSTSFLIVNDQDFFFFVRYSISW